MPASALGAVCALACLAVSGPPRWVAAALLVSYLPGRAVRVALRWEPRGVVLAGASDVVLSLCCVVLAGLALDGTEAGIRFSTMLPAISAVAIIAPLTALLGQSRSRERRPPSHIQSLLKTVAVPTAVFVFFAGVSLAVAARSAMSADTSIKTTDLSILTSHPGVASVSVTNFEHTAKVYRLFISTPGEPTVVVRAFLRSGGTYVLSVPTRRVRANARLTATLYLGSTSSPYRQVWLVPTRPRGQPTGAGR